MQSCLLAPHGRQLLNAVCSPAITPPNPPNKQVLAGLVPLNKYIITKQLTKNPSDYPDAKNQPHVQVRMVMYSCIQILRFETSRRLPTACRASCLLLLLAPFSTRSWAPVSTSAA